MTRKDYILIAEVFSERFVNTSNRIDSVSSKALKESIGMELNAIQATAIKMAHALHRDNPRFDETRFLDMCGF